MKLSKAYNISEALIELGPGANSKMQVVGLTQSSDRFGQKKNINAYGIDPKQKEILKDVLAYLREMEKEKLVTNKFDKETPDITIEGTKELIKVTPDNPKEKPIIITFKQLEDFKKAKEKEENSKGLKGFASKVKDLLDKQNF